MKQRVPLETIQNTDPYLPRIWPRLQLLQLNQKHFEYTSTTLRPVAPLPASTQAWKSKHHQMDKTRSDQLQIN